MVHSPNNKPKVTNSITSLLVVLDFHHSDICNFATLPPHPMALTYNPVTFLRTQRRV